MNSLITPQDIAWGLTFAGSSVLAARNIAYYMKCSNGLPVDMHIYKETLNVDAIRNDKIRDTNFMKSVDKNIGCINKLELTPSLASRSTFNNAIYSLNNGTLHIGTNAAELAYQMRPFMAKLIVACISGIVSRGQYERRKCLYERYGKKTDDEFHY